MATDHRGRLVGNPNTMHGGHTPTFYDWQAFPRTGVPSEGPMDSFPTSWVSKLTADQEAGYPPQVFSGKGRVGEGPFKEGDSVLHTSELKKMVERRPSGGQTQPSNNAAYPWHDPRSDESRKSQEALANVIHGTLMNVVRQAIIRNAFPEAYNDDNDDW